MKRSIFAFLAGVGLLLMAACANMTAAPTPNGLLSVAYSALGTFDEQVGQAAFAGRLKAAKATSLLDESDKVRSRLAEARALLRGCGGKLPCESFDTSLQGINDYLAELQCRRRQAEAGLPEDPCKLPPRAKP